MESLLVLQWVLSSIASMMVGVLWYSEMVFGKLWWRYQFPGTVFGDTSKMRKPSHCIMLTMMATLLQNGVLVLFMNTLLPLFASYSSDAVVGVKFPALLTATVAWLCASSSFCHYLYGNKPLELFLICSGHNTVQLAAGIFTVYMLAVY